MKKSIGKVSLIGAGPGDPGLITVKGLRLLAAAEVVIYDHLVNQNLLDFAKAGAKKIDVGKQVGKRLVEQEEINMLLVREAKRGKKVVRLKGGDPFIFGRGGEEVEALARQGVPFEVVPGITSAIAAPAYAGIPLTYRGLSSSVAIVTGHEDSTKGGSSVDFSKIAQSTDTLVCLMGVGRMDEIISEIRKSRRSPETPVAIIERGTYSRQRVLKGSLKNIGAKVRSTQVKPPAVMVVGEVVRLRSTPSWFESLPLFGKTVVVTRAREQARSLIDLLEQAGAEVIPFPTIDIVPPESFRLLDEKIARLSEYDFLVFTSVNGVEAFLSRLKKLSRDVRCLQGVTIAALGEITAHTLREHCLCPEIVPAVFTSKHLAEEFRRGRVKGKRILLIRSELSSEFLPIQLKKMGACVDEVAGYTLRVPQLDVARVTSLFRQRQVDLITFTSPSTFDHFTVLMRGEQLAKLLRGVKVTAIGPVTRREIQKRGIRVALTASTHTAAGLADTIIAYYHSRKR